MRAAIAPRSNVMNAEDLLTGERTFTVTAAKVDMSKERPVSIWFAEFPEGRPFQPSVTVCRIFAKLWGEEESEYVGRKVTLYRDETVKWAGQPIGGIRVRAMSHIGKKPVQLALAESSKTRAQWTVLPLADEAPTSPALTETEVRIASLRNEWKTATDERKAAIELEVAALTQPDAATDASADPTAEDAFPEADPDIPDPNDGNDPWVDEKDASA